MTERCDRREVGPGGSRATYGFPRAVDCKAIAFRAIRRGADGNQRSATQRSLYPVGNRVCGVTATSLRLSRREPRIGGSYAYVPNSRSHRRWSDICTTDRRPCLGARRKVSNHPVYWAAIGCAERLRHRRHRRFRRLGGPLGHDRGSRCAGIWQERWAGVPVRQVGCDLEANRRAEGFRHDRERLLRLLGVRFGHDCRCGLAGLRQGRGPGVPVLRFRHRVEAGRRTEGNRGRRR